MEPTNSAGGRETAGWLVSSADYQRGRLITTGQYTKMAIDNALMVLFALATADKGTVLFHAAVVSHQGRGYMFLGPSGTGKSTHARLWLKHIGGTELVNDDNPVVRQGVVYGSPWSGKTPCYRNVSYPLGGIVVLSQAPYNKIEQLGGIAGLRSTDVEHQRQALGRTHCRRSASNRERAGHASARMALRVPAR